MISEVPFERPLACFYYKKKGKTILEKQGLHMTMFCRHTSSLDESLINSFGEDPF